MDHFLVIVIGVLWIAWLVYWFAEARDVKTTRWREPWAAQLLYRVPLMIGVLLFVARDRLPEVLTRRFATPTAGLLAASVAITALGLGFAVWARRHLGRNWSANVEVKENHALIRTGPYRYVRHPIYTGLLLAFCGSALATGEWRGPLAVILAFLSFVRKTSVEERRMRATFPEYERYRQNTPRLVPFIY